MYQIINNAKFCSKNLLNNRLKAETKVDRSVFLFLKAFITLLSILRVSIQAFKRKLITCKTDLSWYPRKQSSDFEMFSLSQKQSFEFFIFKTKCVISTYTKWKAFQKSGTKNSFICHEDRDIWTSSNVSTKHTHCLCLHMKHKLEN